MAALSKNDVAADPVEFFGKWMKEAIEAGLDDATSMALATIGPDGFPQSRIVLLKSFGPEGFIFFSNYKSEKGKAIAAQPKVSLHFFWPELERQIRITGTAKKTTAEISDKYFHSRPNDSRIAAVVSEQSSEIASRKVLEDKFNDLKQKLAGKDPDRPEHWGGYAVHPIRFEFWQGRENRLHDRIVYEKVVNFWTIKRLAP